MAIPPPNDPNTPRTTDPYATGRPAEPEKKSKVLPIVIGVIVLAVLAWFLLGMMSSDDEVATTDPVAETQVNDPAATSDTVVTEPVDTVPATTPAPATEPVVPATEVPATDAAPATDTGADAAAPGATDDGVTVEIVEPDATTPPLEGADTTTVPLQTPDTAPAN